MTIKEDLLTNCKDFRIELARIRATRKFALTLPPEILKLRGAFNLHRDGEGTLSLYDESSFDLLFDLGCVFESSYTYQGHRPWRDTNQDSFSVTGEWTWNGCKISVVIGNLPKPETCVVESFTEEVTKFRAVCKETGAKL